jgi:uncharacterized protein (TIGR04255 family)
MASSSKTSVVGPLVTFLIIWYYTYMREFNVFKDVKIPRRIDSPIQEAVFEVRFEENFPGEALYGMLFDVFEQFPEKNPHALPILQIPQQMRDIDPNLRYQPYYRAVDKNYTLSVGPRSIIFSILRPYRGWTEWTKFIHAKFELIHKKNIIQRVERMGLRTVDLFEKNIFEGINAGITVNGHEIKTNPSGFFTEFSQEDINIRLNVGNAANVNGGQTGQSLIDIDCVYQCNSDSLSFFSSYKSNLDKMHLANKKVFFGLLKDDLLMSLNPEF